MGADAVCPSELQYVRSHEVSPTTRLAGGFLNGLRPIEHECSGPTRYRSCEKNVRLESALVRLARNQVTWGEMGRLRLVER